MPNDPKLTPPSSSFSAARRWKIVLDAILRTALVLAVLVMANYIGSLFSRQFFLSSQTRVQLSSRTVDLLRSMTNQIDVTVYYDKNDGMYTTVMALLNEYHRLDPRINIKVVDYVRNPGEALQIKEKYNLATQLNNPTGPPIKNLVIFDCHGNFKLVPADLLVQLGPDGVVTKDKKIEFAPVAFKGEMIFTSTLLAITNPKPFTAYYLQGHNEPSPGDSGNSGYMKFESVLEQDYIRLLPLNLVGDTDVPSDCNLLVIVGPRSRFDPTELAKIDHYLSQGGRMLALLDSFSADRPTGLEGMLADWGVNVVADTVQDRTDTYSGNDVIVKNFSTHPVVNPLVESELELFSPRPIGRVPQASMPADPPTVTELATSSPNSILVGHREFPPQSYPLMVAVEKNSVKGIANAHGDTRIVVVGDSYFLDNQLIDAAANRDFAGYAVNWLLDRPMLLQGIGPRPVPTFRLLMTPSQMRNLCWLLLAALPGAILALGWLVWLRRRK